MKPANRGAREVPKHNVTMMKAKRYPKTPRPGLKRAIRQKTRPPDLHRAPPPCSEEPERHHRKGDNWTGTPEPKALREKRKSPGERDRWHFRTSTSRIANHSEKAETDKSTRRQGQNHGERKGRCQEQRPYRYARTRKHDHPLGREVSHRI